jgi:hypothetical protein
LQKSLEDKAEKLLEILEQKDTDTIPIFINSLKLKYDWIHQKLTEDVPDSHLSKVIPILNKTSPKLRRNKLFDNVLLEESVFDTHKGTSSNDQKFKMMLEIGKMPNSFGYNKLFSLGNTN